MVELRSDVEVTLEVGGFSRPNGQQLLSLSDSLFPGVFGEGYSYEVFLFHPVNPWADGFNRCLGRVLAAGLQLEIMRRAK